MTFDPIVYFGILLLAIAVTLLTSAAFASFSGRLGFRFLLGGICMGVIASVCAATGLLANFDRSPPPFGIAVLLFFLGPIWLGRSRYGKDVADAIPIQILVLIQAFRLPLELVMHEAANVGLMPEQLSFSGWNFDIMTGASALVLGVALMFHPGLNRRFIWLWNIWGSLCLLVIAGIAIFSSPVFLAFGDEPENINTWVLYFPYVLLPALLVTNAIFTHVVIFRKLRAADKVWA
ncbi:MAG: hypothetical protein H8E15_02790 [Planctomycetes bacterium]|nr:hypothetical protein [Planctomycetota bacterium]